MGIALSIIVDGLNTYLHDEAILREIIVGRYRKLRNFWWMRYLDWLERWQKEKVYVKILREEEKSNIVIFGNDLIPISSCGSFPNYAENSV